MLSRRNIRVKVMQTLYSIENNDSSISTAEAINILKKNLDQASQLFTYLVYFITEVARYAEKDAHHKAGKHLPTQADLSVNTRIAGNTLVWQALENPSFKKAVSQYKLESNTDEELVKKVYLNLVASAEYKEYIALPAREKKSEKKIVDFIFNTLMLPDENFTGDIEEKFTNWDDDADMMVTLMGAFLSKPVAFNFAEMVGAEKATFANDLLAAALEKREHCLELIKPKLKNWDADRIAALDMLLMQMGICELLYFETIPPRVTINEYIDLAKDYSTEQSGHFVNGILDNIHKELLAAGKIHKKNYKNSTL
jgi:transcription antitermination protein NusB